MSKKTNSELNIPNGVSFLAMFLACTAIVLLIEGLFYYSFATILLAFIMDALDGYLARKLDCASDFGRQLDGYVDLFTYLLYPALSYFLHFELRSGFDSLMLFLFIACGVYRLARFNIVGFIPSGKQKKGVNYQGMPVYFNLLFLLASICLHALSQTYFHYLVYLLIPANCLLMISRIPFVKPRRILLYVLLVAALSGIFYFLGAHAHI